MNLHLHLTEGVTIGSVDMVANSPRPGFVAVQIRGGSVLLRQRGGIEVTTPVEVIQIYLDPKFAFELAGAIVSAIPLDVPVRTLAVAV